jgi:hypothetical protein
VGRFEKGAVILTTRLNSLIATINHDRTPVLLHEHRRFAAQALAWIVAVHWSAVGGAPCRGESPHRNVEFMVHRENGVWKYRIDKESFGQYSQRGHSKRRGREGSEGSVPAIRCEPLLKG